MTEYDLDERDIITTKIYHIDSATILYMILGVYDRDEIIDLFMNKYVQDESIADFIEEVRELYSQVLEDIYGDNYPMEQVRFYPLDISTGVDLYIFTDDYIYNIDQSEHPFPYWLYRGGRR